MWWNVESATHIKHSHLTTINHSRILWVNLSLLPSSATRQNTSLVTSTPTSVSAVKTVTQILRLFLSQVTRELNNTTHVSSLTKERSSKSFHSLSQTKVLTKLFNTASTANRTRLQQVRNVNNFLRAERSLFALQLEHQTPKPITLNLNLLRIQHNKVYNLTLRVAEHADKSVTVKQKRNNYRIVESVTRQINVRLLHPARSIKERQTCAILLIKSPKWQCRNSIGYKAYSTINGVHLKDVVASNASAGKIPELYTVT